MVSTRTAAKMTIHQQDPLNTETPPNLLLQSFFTPREQFYIRSHGNLPQIDPTTYRLQVNGMVQRPLEITLDELRSAFPSTTVAATMECAGNRRNELMKLQAIHEAVAWGSGAIGHALWHGVPLHKVLEQAGIQDDSSHIAFLGMDDIYEENKHINFGASLIRAKAMRPEVLLAYEMNGEPLLPAHGFPVRLVVPGYVGARSVKWLSTITAQKHHTTNYFQAREYKRFPPDVQPDTVNWNKGEMLEDQPLNAVICQPKDGAHLTSPYVHVQGYAITGGGYTLEAVELSWDGGETWIQARLEQQPEPWAWVFWEATPHLPPGTHQLLVRARDTSVHMQPAKLAEAWNFKGYANNAWHRINVTMAENTH